MPVTLDATVGGESANSYVTLAEALSYFDTRPGSGAFAGLSSDDDRKRALIQATRDIDLYHRFHGSKVNLAQARQFPRTTQGDTSVIPELVRVAALEQALHVSVSFGTGGSSKRDTLRAEGVLQITMGNHSETLASSRPAGPVLCGRASELLKGFRTKAGMITVAGRYETRASSDPWWFMR